MIRDILNAAAGGSTDWWLAAGVTPQIAYQPKGAASLAASYINLANPGTYDASPGVAPTLVSEGWNFTGSQYLSQQLVLPLGTIKMVTMLIKYNLSDILNTIVFGASRVGHWFMIYHDTVGRSYFYNGDNAFISENSISGVFGISGTKAFANGAMLSGTFAEGSGNIGAVAPLIGARGTPSPSNYMTGTVSAYFYTDSVLTESQVLAVMNRMSEL